MSIELEIKQIISDQFSFYEKIENYYNFREKFESDEFDEVELIMDIEDKYAISIEENDFIKKVKTVEDMIIYIRNILEEWEEIESRFEILDIGNLFEINMSIEIERKFLLNSVWPVADHVFDYYYKQNYIRQAYFKNSNEMRVRIVNYDSAYITIKGKRKGISRTEFEYEIPCEEAEIIIKDFCAEEISKTRYSFKENKLIWEIDVFEGDNEGLVLAEVELDSEEQEIDFPDWVGKEVTNDKRYYNSYLSRHPYYKWENINSCESCASQYNCLGKGELCNDYVKEGK